MPSKWPTTAIHGSERLLHVAFAALYGSCSNGEGPLRWHIAVWRQYFVFWHPLQLRHRALGDWSAFLWAWCDREEFPLSLADLWQGEDRGLSYRQGVLPSSLTSQSILHTSVLGKSQSWWWAQTLTNQPKLVNLSRRKEILRCDGHSLAYAKAAPWMLSFISKWRWSITFKIFSLAWPNFGI